MREVTICGRCTRFVGSAAEVAKHFHDCPGEVEMLRRLTGEPPRPRARTPEEQEIADRLGRVLTAGMPLDILEALTRAQNVDELLDHAGSFLDPFLGPFWTAFAVQFWAARGGPPSGNT